MKNTQKIAVSALSVLLIGTLTIPAFAQNLSSEKEEVIYVMTDASGKVTDMEAVNIFAGGNITDYGDYSAVKILNTNDVITQNGEQITFSSDADKVYYQGTMKDTEIPWNISIRYFLDGKEYSAEDIAGKSGALEIRFSVSKNESCRGDFYDNYALQASFVLDTDICRNIVSGDATVANVGSDKQLTYTILPSRGISTSVYADVTDFEMDDVTINGVRLNMNVEVDDTELMDKVDEIISAIGSIDDGASEVNEGTGKLYDAAGTLKSKVAEFNTGVGTLTQGAGSLYSGFLNITAKNDALTGAAYTAYEGLCNSAAAALNAQLGAMGMGPVTLTPSSYSEVLTGLIEKMDAESAKPVLELKGQLDNYGAFYQGLLDYTGAVSDAAEGTNTLKLNMDTLYGSTGELETAVGELNDAVGRLYDGTGMLKDGTSEFADKTSDMDTQISDEIESMTSSITGGDSETVSFVSDKNTNVDSVQFVIKTASIEQNEEPVGEETEETTLNFWQKLLNLFGIK